MFKFSLLIVLGIFYNSMLLSNVDNDSYAKGKSHIMILKGNTSIFIVDIVKITQKNNELDLSFRKMRKNYRIILKLKDNSYTGGFKDIAGEYKIKADKKLCGTFSFTPSVEGKKEFYQKDKGAFQIINFSKENLGKWSAEARKQLFGYDSDKSVSEIAKHSPLLRRQIAQDPGFIKMAQKDNVPIKFYGKVVDQFGEPVANADVYLGIRFTPLIMWANMDKNYKLKTDQDGNFTLSGTGNQVIIDKIECEGYRTRKTFLQSFSYNTREKFIPDPDNPVVFVISKITDKATYLLINRDFDIELSPGTPKLFEFFDFKYAWGKKHSNYKDIINKKYYKYMDELHEKKLPESEIDKKLKQYKSELEKKYSYEELFLKKHYDFKGEAEFDKEHSDWIITFTATGKNGGFILRDEYLYEAPKEGYKKEFKFIQHILTEKEENILSETKDRKVEEKYLEMRDFVLKGKYLYIKSREPAVYTRMELSDFRAGDTFFDISTTPPATNPYGERSLEPINDELPLDISDECSCVEEYFLEGKLPPKPDIKKMMAEFKKTHKRVRSSYGGWEWVEK